MDDQRLQRLIRMAVEAEGFDTPAGVARDEAPISIVTWRRRFAWVGGGLAAAACLTVAAVVFRAPMTSTPTGPIASARNAPESSGDAGARSLDDSPSHRVAVSPSASAAESQPQPTRLVAQLAEPEEAVVFAVFRGVDGSCECVQVDAPEWSGEKRLADVDRQELVRVAFRDPCSTLAPEVLVIGVSGKPGTVGSSRRHAEALAERLGREPIRGRDIAHAAYAALPDLPPGSLVVAEKVSIRP